MKINKLKVKIMVLSLVYLNNYLFFRGSERFIREFPALAKMLLTPQLIFGDPLFFGFYTELQISVVLIILGVAQ